MFHDVGATVTAFSGVNKLTDILSITVIIMSDDRSLSLDLFTGGGNELSGGFSVFISGSDTAVYLSRSAPGYFYNNPDFDSISLNRGYICLTYK
jgi:hypothetical protein